MNYFNKTEIPFVKLQDKRTLLLMAYFRECFGMIFTKKSRQNI